MSERVETNPDDVAAGVTITGAIRIRIQQEGGSSRQVLITEGERTDAE